MYLTNEPFFRSRFKNRKPTDWAFTKYFLEKGGDVNFEFFWDENYWPGHGYLKGTAMDYVLDIQRKHYSCSDISGLVGLVYKKVILVSLIQLFQIA